MRRLHSLWIPVYTSMRVVFEPSPGSLRSAVLVAVALALAFAVGIATVSVVTGTTISGGEANSTHGSDRQVDAPENAGRSERTRRSNSEANGASDSPGRDNRDPRGSDRSTDRAGAERPKESADGGGAPEPSTSRSRHDEQTNATSVSCSGRSGESQAGQRTSDSGRNYVPPAEGNVPEATSVFGRSVHQYVHNLDQDRSRSTALSEFVPQHSPGHERARTATERVEQDRYTDETPGAVDQACSDSRTNRTGHTSVSDRNTPTGGIPWTTTEDTSQSETGEPEGATSTDVVTTASEEPTTESPKTTSTEGTATHSDTTVTSTTTDTPSGKTPVESSETSGTGGNAGGSGGPDSTDDADSGGTGASSDDRDSSSDSGDGNEVTVIANGDESSATPAAGGAQPPSSVSTDTPTATRDATGTSVGDRGGGPTSTSRRFDGVGTSLIPLALLLGAALFTRRGDDDG